MLANVDRQPRFRRSPLARSEPVEIYRYVDERTDPMVAAVSVVLIGLSILVVLSWSSAQ